MMGKNNGVAVPDETFGMHSNDLVIGHPYKREAHTLTIRRIETHHGNLQVCFFDDFELKSSWEHISTFRGMQEGKRLDQLSLWK
jgi:hypothetical protein